MSNTGQAKALAKTINLKSPRSILAVAGLLILGSVGLALAVDVPFIAIEAESAASFANTARIVPDGLAAGGQAVSFSTAGPSTTKTLTFDDLGGAIHLNDIFYNIDWGYFLWHTYDPYKKLTTYNFTYNNPHLRSAAFTFMQPTTVVSLDAYDENATNTVTLKCPPNPDKTFTIPFDVYTKMTTGWTSPCTVMTIDSVLGWSTNFDNLTITTSN